MMNGSKGRLFWGIIRLIFLGILCIFTLGIGFLFLIPFAWVYFANFYDDLKANAPSDEIITEPKIAS